MKKIIAIMLLGLLAAAPARIAIAADTGNTDAPQTQQDQGDNTDDETTPAASDDSSAEPDNQDMENDSGEADQPMDNGAMDTEQGQ